MHWLQALDTAVFRFINLGLANPVFDTAMPFLSGNKLFIPAVFVGGAWLVWKQRCRGVLFLLLMAVVLSFGDGFICNTLKHLVGRDRPFWTLPDVRCLVGRSSSGSMPSAHAANWFAATMVAFFFYRRSLWFMLPMAVLVSFSRIYNGVHYPSDVLAGAILGAGSAVAVLWLLETLWGWAGRKVFPLWWQKCPSLITPRHAFGNRSADLSLQERTTRSAYRSPGHPAEATEEEEMPTSLPPRRGIPPSGFQPPQAELDAHWLRLGFLLIAVLLVARWVYIGGNTIQLAEDEAYQWLWSKHLALSYYSKPPLIAYTQFLGTTLWGDTAFGVRFFSPVISALISVLLLRFFAREINARAGFFLLLVATTTPLMSAGSILMTVDPLSVLFWTAAMLAGWRAIQERATTTDWLWVGLWMGLGFLSKYTELLQLLCWAVFFVLWAPARKQLRRPGPYLAVLVNLVCAFPVLWWNYHHGWITVQHVGEDAGVGQPWEPTLRHAGEFLGAELGLLNPVFFIGMIWAAIAFWRRNRRDPRLVFFFSMGAPVFLVFLLHSFKSRVLPNWIAPGVLPLFCLMVIYWDMRFRLGQSRAKTWLASGLVLGLAVCLLGHDTNLVKKVTGSYLPVKLDPLHRVREWDTTAQAVEGARQRLLSEGKPVFIIADHYGMTGQLSFYIPPARNNVVDHPLVYFPSTPAPVNQFFFWPGYEDRKGENAVFVRQLDRSDPEPLPPGRTLEDQFESVTDMGVTNVLYHGQLLRPLQIFACQGLR